MTFYTLVKQYGKIHKLGKQIIKHKGYINNVSKTKIDLEFEKQEKRIQEFIELTNDVNSKWKENHQSINEYWTGY
jgi:predicted DNA-binding WGR domain protein